MTPAVAALLSLISALIVAILNHFFTTKRKRSDELAEFRLKAYTDFINAASRLITARRMGQIADELSELTALNDAKTRICICANEQVVKALADFWNLGGTLEKESEILAFTRLCYRIRESLGHKGYVNLYPNGLSEILFKLEPSSYSFKGSRKSSAP